jgi:hypothetical protein
MDIFSSVSSSKTQSVFFCELQDLFTSWNGGLIPTNELERMRKETGKNYLKLLSQDWLERTEKNHEKSFIQEIRSHNWNINLGSCGYVTEVVTNTTRHFSFTLWASVSQPDRIMLRGKR